MNVFLEIAIIFVLFLINGFFSMSEIALISSRKVRLEQRAEEGDRGAAAALELTRSANRLLSSVQIGITLVSMFTGVLGGATLANQLTKVLVNIHWLAPYAGGVSLVIVVFFNNYF